MKEKKLKRRARRIQRLFDAKVSLTFAIEAAERWGESEKLSVDFMHDALKYLMKRAKKAV